MNVYNFLKTAFINSWRKLGGIATPQLLIVIERNISINEVEIYINEDINSQSNLSDVRLRELYHKNRLLIIVHTFSKNLYISTNQHTIKITDDLVKDVVNRMKLRRISCKPYPCNKS